MSDILEDQKIHYIVKDYRRMYNGFHALREEKEELQRKVNEKDIEILRLQSSIKDLKNELDAARKSAKKPQKAITAKFNDLEVRTDSMMKLLEKVMSHAQNNINNIEELSVLIKEK